MTQPPDLDTIRRMLDDGTPIPPWIVRGLVERCGEQRHEHGELAYLAECERIEAEHHRETLREIARHTAPVVRERWDAQQIDRYMRARLDDGIPLADKRLLSGAARAWDDAIGRCDGIVAAEERLREALRGL